MANATAFPSPYGWEYINDTTQFNPIKASVKAWELSAGNGIAWDLATATIILLVPTAIYLRSQNYVAAAFGQLLVTMFMQYYGLVSKYILVPSYIMIILMIALPIAFKWMAKR